MSTLILNEVRPILKWPGGKRKLLSAIIPLIPEKFETYFEPFLGGGALFFALRPHTAVLGDLNSQLINLYLQIEREPIRIVSGLNNILRLRETLSEDEQTALYYSIRDKFNKDVLENRLTVDTAVYFIYLNKTCFNGIYRVNGKGEFNVPVGINPGTLPTQEEIFSVSDLFREPNIKLLNCSYSETLKNVSQNDFVYLDPPYYKANVKYDKNDFKELDQIKLKDEVVRLTNIGAKVMISNSNTDFIKDLYSDFTQIVLDTTHSLNRNPERRAKELLITNYRHI